MSREIVWIHSNPIYVNCKKHYCPDCNTRLGKITESRIIRPYSSETSKFEYPVTDRSHSELRETKFCCPDCGKIISVPDMKRIEGVSNKRSHISLIIILIITLIIFSIIYLYSEKKMPHDYPDVTWQSSDETVTFSDYMGTYTENGIVTEIISPGGWTNVLAIYEYDSVNGSSNGDYLDEWWIIASTDNWFIAVADENSKIFKPNEIVLFKRVE